MTSTAMGNNDIPMDFQNLYTACEQDMVSRELNLSKTIVLVREIKDRIIACTPWLSGVNIYGTECQEGDPLGHYECHSEAESKWDDPDSWVSLITYDNTLNDCKRRFVQCKELMHIFDTKDGQVASGEAYVGFLGEIELNPLEVSEAYSSENFAKWMALLILCPKVHRDVIIDKQKTDPKNNYQIALDLRIPESVVPSLFSTYYDEAYSKLILE